MTLLGSRVGTAINGDVLTALQAAFPCPASLSTAQKSAYNAAQASLASCIGTPVGTDMVTEITTNAVVPAAIAVTIPTTASPGSPSTGETTAPGTVT